jgi:arylsulfatase
MADAADRPNVILIMVDDMGFSDIGCYGSEIATPNIDALAAGGIRFSQFYNSARCCPTRASLLTGLHPHQAGIGHMTVDFEVAPYRGFLNQNCVTIAEALGSAGYTTLMAGKWHAGGDYPFSRWKDVTAGDATHPTPRQRGFQHFYGTLAGSGSFFDPHTLMRDDEYIEPEDYGDYYYTDAIAANAAGFIEEHGQGDAPFFLYVGFTAPHWPLHAFEEDIEKYRGKYAGGWDAIRTARHEEQKGMGLLDSKWEISPRDEKAPDWNDVDLKDWEDARMAVYAAQVDRMDQGIGQIMAKVRELGMEDNTLVMFLTDNGGCAELLQEDGIPDTAPRETRDGRTVQSGNVRGLMPGGETTYLSYDLPWANVSDTPFKLFKHFTHEGGISTPFIAYWPNRIAANGMTHSAGWIGDVMATCLDAAGARYPKEFNGHAITPLEGESLLSAFADEDWTRDRPIVIEHEGNVAVRVENWKLVRRYPGEFELYDIDADRTELDDRAVKNPGKLRELTGLYTEFAEKVGVVEWSELVEHPAGARFKKWL